ncbi:MAG: hypothetical protein COY40_03025 [Alphaproteobacteria bacterium CG_4_10_14_0_8_um_filter_53_9]|nr:MAG: hypothetical protein COY40_03025 [Alphaproteobacteria bacterium CG_4_10_14_0_8_um_filter_53_9]
MTKTEVVSKQAGTAGAQAEMDITAWYDKQFLPWREAVRTVTLDEEARKVKLQRHIGQLQTIVAMLMDGKAKSALMAWNALQLHPTLTAIALADNGDSLALTEQSGKNLTLRMDDVVAELEGLLREREVPQDGAAAA